MRRFNQFKRRLHASTDSMFAERVRIVAWVDGREDPDRPPREIVAPIIEEDRDTQNLAGDRSDTFSANIRTGGAVLKPDPVAYPDLNIRAGDTVIALDRPSEPQWRVSSIDPPGNGRLIINLGDSA